MAPHHVLKRSQLVVLGMHRSGTSLLTRILHFMGASFGGGANLLPPNANNPEGFWERGDVCALNEHMLQIAGADWFRVLPFAPDRLPDHERENIRAHIRTIVQLMNQERPWVMKDPRLCLTFPLWRDQLDEPFVILASRDPAAVAKSLRRRDGFPVAAGLALWEFHTLAALRASTGLPRLVAPTDLFGQDPIREARRLRQELTAAGVAGLREPEEPDLRAFVKPGLIQGSDDGIPLRAIANAAQVQLHEALQDRSALTWAAPPPLSDGARLALEELAEDWTARELNAAHHATELARQQQQLDEITRTVGVMENSVLLRITHATMRLLQRLRGRPEPIPFDRLRATLPRDQVEEPPHVG